MVVKRLLLAMELPTHLLGILGKLASIIIGLALWVLVLELILPFSGDWPISWLPATAIYAVLILLITHLVQGRPRANGVTSWTASWWRLGLVLVLVLGGILGLGGLEHFSARVRARKRDRSATLRNRPSRCVAASGLSSLLLSA